MILNLKDILINTLFSTLKILIQRDLQSSDHFVLTKTKLFVIHKFDRIKTFDCYAVNIFKHMYTEATLCVSNLNLCLWLS